MNQTLFAIGIGTLCFNTAHAAAQVQPGYSSVTSHGDINLTGDNGREESTLIDDQDMMLDPLGADVELELNNSNGLYVGSVSGYASFDDAMSGSFYANSDFGGTDFNNSDAVGSFGHTFSTELEYQFMIDGEGELEIEGTLINLHPDFEYFVRLSVSSEFMPGTGFAGNFFDESILDTQDLGSLDFARVVPLIADSGSYRLRITLSHSGIGQREQDLRLGSLAASFSISTGAGCPADLTGDGELNFFDVSAFLSAYASQDPIADFNGDGVYDFFDVSAFLSAFTGGCP